MQSAGYSKLKEITEDSILSVFLAADGKLAKGMTYFYAVKRMLTVCAEVFETARIVPLVPIIAKHRKTVQYLTPTETAKIRQVLEADDSPLNLRDKAIGILAY
jgi:esterase/lipase